MVVVVVVVTQFRVPKILFPYDNYLAEIQHILVAAKTALATFLSSVSEAVRTPTRESSSLNTKMVTNKDLAFIHGIHAHAIINSQTNKCGRHRELTMSSSPVS